MTDRPITEISLKDVRKLIEDKDLGEDIADTVGNILGVVLALSPVVAGPAAAASLWGLIEPKNELIDALKSAVRKISRSKPSDYLERAERMAAAHCLLVYVSFFDGFRLEWPSIVERLGISEEAARRALTGALSRVQLSSPGARSIADWAVMIPHPTGRESPESREEIFARLANILTSELPMPAKASDSVAARLTPARLAQGIIGRAEALYRAEFLGMAIEFHQFFVWSMLRDQDGKAQQLQKLAMDQQAWFQLTSRAMYALDLGMRGLAEAVARLPGPALTEEAGGGHPGVRAIAEALHRTYTDALQQQVIDDRFVVDDTGARLGFPRKIDGFIPQACQAITYDSRDMHLEDDATWHGRKVHDNIGAFIVQYLESPYSVRTPLLVLGHPGSGKSLLTEVLAGHLAYPAYTTVRVKLRDVDPDSSFLTQLRAQIAEDTGGRSIEWADLADGLGLCPPVIILDGYDELLQATGKVYASYLDEIRQFQHQQAIQHRPVRVIVTSRLTLIDKAAVPPGTTIVKLEEFDQSRRAAWCRLWNARNQAYFQQNGIQPFAVPDNARLLELARQPLLLVMLAIYDSLGNELSSQPDIDQTLLYDRLLRRFIERELSKGKLGREFAARPDAERAAAIDREMDRLGVAAIGMFNRRDVKISREDLNSDLRYFDRQKGAGAEGRALAEADMLLGSFFFIHVSRSRLQPESAATGSVAFEFLHNTFGEFLTADFILRRVMEEAQTICALAGNPRLHATHSDQLERLSEGWFGALLHTPLHTRPVILRMIREWSRTRLGDRHWPRSDALAAVDAITATQLRVVLNDMTIPEPDPSRRRLSEYPELPRRGHLAIYSLNLILLRAYLDDADYVVAEGALGEWAGATRPWDALASLWRSWFQLESLGALAQAFTATRSQERIVITAGQSELAQGMGSPLTDLYSSSVALADRVTAACAGLHIVPFARMPESIFTAFWDGFGDAVPELGPLASVMRLKMYATAGDELVAPPPGSPDASLRLSLDLTEEASQVASDFADVVARLARTPRQRRRVEVARDLLSGLGQLSRYEAEAAVAARVELDPSWLRDLLTVGPEQGAWDSFVQNPAAAPVLRAAVQEFDRRQARLAVDRINDDVNVAGTVFADIDAATALTVLSHAGGSTALCARLLDIIIEECRRGAWHLLDIPVSTWEGLADLFCSADPAFDASRAGFLALLESAVAESMSDLRGDALRDADALAAFWVQALRIGVTRNREPILQAMEGWIASAPELSALNRREGQFLLPLLGWAREAGGALLARRVMRLVSNSEWVTRLGQRAEAVNDADVARLLTHRDAMDLRWALEAMGQHKGSEPRRHRKRG